MTDTPLTRVLKAVENITGHSPQHNGTGWKTRCPAHEDDNPSLSVGRGDDGKVILHCYAGCKPEAVVKAVGLTLADLMPARSSNGHNPKPTIVAAYDYTDEAGKLLFQVVRFNPKDFRQRRPDGHGGWVWKLDDVRRVPYRLHELIQADPATWVFVVEGEKDADALAALGLTATTNPGGAGKWHLVDCASLTDRRVAVIPDNDDAGRNHARDVAIQLNGKAADVRIVELPNLPPKGDVSDWLRSGGTADQLLTLAETAPTWEPAETPHPDPDDDPATDESKPKKKQSERILETILPVAELFHSGDGVFATVPVGEHSETYPIRSQSFKRWILHRCHTEARMTVSTNAMEEILSILSAKAAFDGPELPVFTRLAEAEGAVWLDLCNEQWQTVRIDSDGWEIVNDSPVKFLRRRGMKPLPVPVNGGSVGEFRRFVNLPDPESWALTVAWLVAALRPSGPYPVLVLNGEHGSAKSTLSKMLRSLIDPNVSPCARNPANPATWP